MLWKLSASPIARKPSGLLAPAIAVYPRIVSTTDAATDATAAAPTTAAGAGATGGAAAPGVEYLALRHGCGLVDRSERGKLALTGPGAVEFLNGQVTNELGSLHPGEGCYAAFLTHKGKMLGDLRILAVGEVQAEPPSALLLDTERVALQGLFDMIRRFKVGYDLELQKRTLESGMVSLVGPQAENIAMRALEDPPAASEPAGAAQALGHTEHSHIRARIAGCAVRLIRTAEPAGVDVLCDSGDADTVRSALIEAGAVAVSQAATEIVRVEHGRPRYGVELDDSVIPQEAGLNERAVSFTKGCYVGQETVARLHYRGKPNRHLRGLRLSAPVTGGEELHLGERVVGRVASAVVSPELGPIALALVRREAEPGATVSVGEQGASAEVTELPFAPASAARERAHVVGDVPDHR
jgi:folate-binding protein YgfZ